MSEDIGKKADTGKAPVYNGFMQYFPRAIMSVANISKYGVEKYELDYEDKNFLKVDNAFARYADAQMRHVLYRAMEGELDLEAKALGYDCMHLAMDAWNAMAKLEMFLIEKEKNG